MLGNPSQKGLVSLNLTFSKKMLKPGFVVWLHFNKEQKLFNKQNNLSSNFPECY